MENDLVKQTKVGLALTTAKTQRVSASGSIRQSCTRPPDHDHYGRGSRQSVFWGRLGRGLLGRRPAPKPAIRGAYQQASKIDPWIVLIQLTAVSEARCRILSIFVAASEQAVLSQQNDWPLARSTLSLSSWMRLSTSARPSQ
jgi:hypothetical protein